MIFSLFFASQIFFMFIFHFNRKAFKSHECNKEPDSVVPILNLKRKCFFPLNSNKFQHNPRSYLLRQNNSFNAFLVKILILGASGLPFSFTLYRPLIWPKLVINWPSPPEWHCYPSHWSLWESSATLWRVNGFGHNDKLKG